ncbi:ORF19 [Lymantria xylina nucleopolyhedrovirus]|uniref:ORF19 n=1 Tax=Lymantria xylina multiple nucleopolyhedrovirus TaxID=2847840 RepID=D4N256_9ABAC|nr:ORF19 [Lymantria xylina nucleopolyhedrovirus]ADD73728.1 ORF19 [Lymantria xylina nucleopolyhedrovirus]
MTTSCFDKRYQCPADAACFDKRYQCPADAAGVIKAIRTLKYIKSPNTSARADSLS